MVFHTAPPQPASKARMICSPQLVGGAEASQNGLGELIPPANPRMLRSGISGLRGHQDREGGAFAIGHRIHNLASAVDAVAACKVTRIAGLAGSAVSDDALFPHLDVAQLLQKLSQ